MNEKVYSFRKTIDGSNIHIEDSTNSPIFKFELQGNMLQNGVPTPDSPIEIGVLTGDVNVDVVNKNIIDLRVKQEWDTISGLSYTEVNDSEIILSGTPTTTWSSRDLKNAPIVKKGKKYRMTARVYDAKSGAEINPTGGMYIRLRDKNDSNISQTFSVGFASNKQKTITAEFDSDPNYAIIVYQSFNTSTNYNMRIKIQLEEGEITTEHTEHKSQTYPLSLENLELCGKDNVRDYFSKEADGWYFNEFWEKLIITSSTFGSWRFADGTFQNRANWINNYNFKNSYCNYFKAGHNAFAQVKNLNNSLGGGSGTLFIRADSFNEDVAVFTNWLVSTEEGNDPFVIYVRKNTPEKIKITDEALISQLNALSKARTYNGITNIYSTGSDIEPFFNIDYRSTQMDKTDEELLSNKKGTILTKIEVLPISENEESIILTEENSVVSWNHEDFRYVKDQGFIGQFVARQVNGTLKNISDDFSITDREFILWLGIKNEEDVNWYSLGNFIVTKVTDDEVKDTTTFESMDYTKKFNKAYKDNITYPCTALELAQNVCEQCGVELGSTDFTHSDWEIEGNFFQNGETCRDVLKNIGKLAYSWVRVDWDNKVYFDFTKHLTTEQTDIIDNSKYYNLKTQKDKVVINRVVIGYKDIQGEQKKVEDTDSIEENGLYEICIWDNPLVYNAELREKAIIGADELLGLEYTPLNTLTIGHPWLIGNELIEIIDMENNIRKTIPFDRTIQYFGHIKSLIDVTTSTKTNTEYAYNSGLEQRVKNAEISVNKLDGEINAVAEDLGKTNKNVADVSIKADGISSKVTEVETTLNNNYYTKEYQDGVDNTTNDAIESVKKSVEAYQTSTKASINIINEQIANGVTKVDALGVTVDKDGLHMEKTGMPMQSTLDWDGLVVKENTKELLSVRSSGVVTENLEVRTFFIQKPIRSEKCTSVTDGSVGLGDFWIGE